MRTQKASASFGTILAWAIYDFANTIYSMNVVTMYFSLWITVNLAREDFWVSIGNSTSMALVALSLPILGALSDSAGRRLPFLFVFTLGAVLGTALIGVTGYYVHHETALLLLAVFFFILANYAYQGALVFYNALLPDVAGPGNIGKVSGFGVSLGYFGAIVGLLMVMPFAQGEISFLHLELPFLQKDWQPVAVLTVDENAHLNQFLDETVGKDENYRYKLVPDSLASAGSGGWTVTSKDTVIRKADGHPHRAVKVLIGQAPLKPGKKFALLRQKSGWGRRGTFIPTAVLFFLFSLPTFIFLREKKKKPRSERIHLREAVRRVWDGLANTRKYPGVLRFLIAKFFYEEGIQTTIIFMAVYAVKVMGFPNESIIFFFIITTTAAAVGSLIFGWVTDWLRPKRTLLLVVSGWVLSLLAIIATNNHTVFWIIGSIVGILMGSTWTAARPLLISLVPEEMVAEFFGLYALSGKVAAIFGPLVWGAAVFLLKPYVDVVRYKGAVFSLALMMALGLALLWKVPAGTLEGKGTSKRSTNR